MRYLLSFLCASSALQAAPQADSQDLRLWYEQPAAVWTEALPVGNGSLGAMIHGRTDVELVQFNEDTLWSGVPHSYAHEGAAQYVDDLRQLLEQGQQDEAEALANDKFMSVPLRLPMYQAFGNLEIDFGHDGKVSDYLRDLDLETAIASVNYRTAGVRYTRHAFSSYPDNVIVQRFTADKKGRISFTLRFTTPHEQFQVEAQGSDSLLLTGNVGPDKRHVEIGNEHEGMAFAARVKVLAEGGKVTTEGDTLTVSKANAVTILLSGDTNFTHFDELSTDPVAETAKVIEAAAGKSYDALARRHAEDYEPLFDRVDIELGNSEFDTWPTDKRLFRDTKVDDPGLAEIFYQYGRYLLIASSRPGSQPANLQGIWNYQLEPAWGSKYTLNINAEMNYWPAEVANLSELHEPFFDMIDDLQVSGTEVAKVHYDLPGWVVHHNTDLWRGAAPINNSNHGIWPLGSGWLVQHLWERFRYTQDMDFLRDRAYPAMRDAALFYSHYLVEDPETGWLISGPSNSPEHGGLVMGPTMDHQIIRSLFGWVIEAEEILGIDDGLAAEIEPLQERIAPNMIGRYGQLQEWLEDVDDPDNEHRHVSHLWGVFPGQDITWDEPEMMQAAKQSLLYRGNGGTGWALGWKISLWARFLDGPHAHQILMNQLNYVRDTPDGALIRQVEGGAGVYPNLFDAHPPFQIDGNFAATAGISEMLMQSHHEVGYGRGKQQKFEIVLLPALPEQFHTGSVQGLRARGGMELDFAWQDSELQELTIRSEKGGEARLRYGDQVKDVALKAGEEKTFGPGLHDMRPYTGDASPLELSQRMMTDLVDRFHEWVPEGRDVPAMWDYSLAIVALGAVDLTQTTGDMKWLEYAEGIVGDCLQADGTIKGYKHDHFNIDMVKPGSPALDLYGITKDERYQQIVEILRGQMREHPRTSEGGFWHKQVYPHQMWLDGLYMGSPFLAQYAKDFNEPELFDDVVQQFVIIDRHAWDAEKQLHHHAWDEAKQQPWADPETGLSSNIWGRSVGWYGMALVDVLEFLPEDHPGRPVLIEILTRWALGVKRWQDPETGLWWQVMDQGDRPGNYLEGTASSQFVYTLAKALNNGWLPRNAFTGVLEDGWNGIHDHLLEVDAKGRLSLTQCCRVAGLSDDRDGSYRYYLSELVISNDLKGVGPFIRAGVEMNTYLNR
ncbi:MAG: glycoside hydrolase family 88 protein [Verrucomicrobiota bacterium JB022]|nr:glycoside hydrolase family 88 protein [Verrucomicrobiota bacterium JB022]